MIKIVKESNIEVTDKASIISKLRRIVTDIERRGELALDKYGLIDMDKFLSRSQFSRMRILNDTVTDLKNIETDIRRDGKAKIRSRLYADFLRDLGFEVTDDGNYAYIVENIKTNTSKRKMCESKKDDVDYYIGVLNFMYGLNDTTENKFTIESAYNKHRLVLEKNSTGGVYPISGYVTIGELFDIVDSIKNVKNKLG